MATRITNYRDLLRFLESYLGKANKPTLADEKTLLNASVGPFMRRKTKEITTIVKDTILADPQAQRMLRQEVGVYMQAMEAIYKSVRPKPFHNFLAEDVGLSDVGAAILVDQLTHDQQAKDLTVSAYGIAGMQNFDPVVLDGIRSSEEGYNLIFGKETPASDTPYADLLSAIKFEKSSVRAETWTRLELYLKSGWAAQDATKPETPTAKALAAWVKAYQKDAEKAMASATEAFRLLEDRFKEKFLVVRINKNHAEILGTLGEAGLRGDGTAGVGQVDAVIMDADGSGKAYAAAVTANEALPAIAMTQILRHGDAMNTTIAAGGLPGINSIELSLTVPSLLATLDPMETDGRKGRGKDLQTALGGLTTDEVQAFNMLPVVAGMYSLPDRQVSHVLVKLFGGEAKEWPRTGSSVTQAGRDELLAQCFGTVVRALGRAENSVGLTAWSTNKLGVILSAIDSELRNFLTDERVDKTMLHKYVSAKDLSAAADKLSILVDESKNERRGAVRRLKRTLEDAANDLGGCAAGESLGM